MSIIKFIQKEISLAIKHLYHTEIEPNTLTINDTKPDFEGDYTLVTFSLTKELKKNPEELANTLGEYLTKQHTLFTDYQVIKGFLNLTIDNQYYFDFLQKQYNNTQWGIWEKSEKKVMVEYSSPNTNKPLHFGHLRNIFLGSAVASILENAGYKVVKANLINDRGIHICKSMIAWQLFANGDTPESTGIKGDHFVGDYYVRFNDEYKKQIEILINDGATPEEAEKNAPILLAAQDLLRKWEQGDEDTINLWKKMNQWVYDGFHISYKNMGISFDQMYYESNTYLLGKKYVLDALDKNIAIQNEDGSVWIDLSDMGLDKKLLLRKDGTSVYITQDIGTAILKYEDYKIDQSIYVIGDEQNYHMDVLKAILKKMKHPCAEGIYHLSYGMVELPHGRMKSREGTVVDADDMFAEMISIAKENTETLGKVKDFSSEALTQLYHTLGFGALKFYLLRVDPRKKMIFNPQESIDFHGFTGPFVQYTHARICSILRKAENMQMTDFSQTGISVTEKNILKQLEQYPTLCMQAATTLNPSELCSTLFTLAKTYNSFLAEHSVLQAENQAIKMLRLQLSTMVKNVLCHGLKMLGIEAPERM